MEGTYTMEGVPFYQKSIQLSLGRDQVTITITLVGEDNISDIENCFTEYAGK